MEGLTRFSDVRLAGVALLSERANWGHRKTHRGGEARRTGCSALCTPLLFWGLSAALSACADLPDSFETTPFLREQITGDTWRACLAREYQLQARAEVRAGRHWAEATALSAKGRAALDGPNQPGTCDCAKAEARRDAIAMKQAAGKDAGTILATLPEADAACAKSKGD
jgi:hypothetical protein